MPEIARRYFYFFSFREAKLTTFVLIPIYGPVASKMDYWWVGWQKVHRFSSAFRTFEFYWHTSTYIYGNQQMPNFNMYGIVKSWRMPHGRRSTFARNKIILFTEFFDVKMLRFVCRSGAMATHECSLSCVVEEINWLRIICMVMRWLWACIR